MIDLPKSETYSLAHRLRGSIAVRVRYAGDDTVHWGVFCGIPPQGVPMSDMTGTVEGY